MPTVQPNPVPANDRDPLVPARRSEAELPKVALGEPADADAVFGDGQDLRSFALYDPMAAFDLVAELDHLTDRAVEANIFFTPQFLVPAMPRLDERHVRLLIARDENGQRSRLRMILPFSVERVGLLRGTRIVRAWTHPFGPIGTVPLDTDDPSGTLATLLKSLAGPQMNLPDVLVLPDQRLSGAVTAKLTRAAAEAGLPWMIVDRRRRAALAASRAGTFRADVLSKKARREFGRGRRMLEREGAVALACATTPTAVRDALEEFLVLEAAGWKGRARSAMLLDRYRSAFAREAINGLAEAGRVRIYTLRVGTATVASLVVLSVKGEAVLWKTAYDEAYAKASPGFQILVEASQDLMADPSVTFVDSCAVPGHELLERLWPDRLEVGTLVIGLTQESGGAVSRAAAGLRRQRAAAYAWWRLRRRFARLVKRAG